MGKLKDKAYISRAKPQPPWYFSFSKDKWDSLSASASFCEKGDIPPVLSLHFRWFCFMVFGFSIQTISCSTECLQNKLTHGTIQTTRKGMLRYCNDWNSLRWAQEIQQKCHKVVPWTWRSPHGQDHRPTSPAGQKKWMICQIELN